MANLVRIIPISGAEFANKPAEFFDLEGYPTVWWKDAAGYHLWPKPIAPWPKSINQPAVTVLYFESGEPAGFVVE